MINIIKEASLTYTNVAKNSNKFYILQIVEENGVHSIIKRYGRLGKSPTVIKVEGTLNFVLDEFDKMINEKHKKGYGECPLEDIIYYRGW